MVSLRRTLATALAASLLTIVPVQLPSSASNNPPANPCAALAEGGDSVSAIVAADGITYCRHVFTTVGSSTFRALDDRITEVDYLVVAGGGGGAARASGGGGGAGGLLSNLNPDGTQKSTPLAVSTTSIEVQVGAGGKGGLGTDPGGGSLWHFWGLDGENSTLSSIVAVGGGGGGVYNGAGLDGRNGGSGGGSGRASTVSSSPVAGQGNPGGRGAVSTHGGGGGGGGAGQAGGNAVGNSDPKLTFGGSGGAGLNFRDAFGMDVGQGGRFAGGGAGAASNGSEGQRAAGGLGGGGNEGFRNSGNGFNGLPGTGGGGGAAANYNNGEFGGDGGSGVVIIRYELPGVFLPPISQTVDTNTDIEIINGLLRPRVQGVGGVVSASLILTHGTMTITDLHGATANGATTGVSSISISGTKSQVNSALATLQARSTLPGTGVLSMSATDTLGSNFSPVQTTIQFRNFDVCAQSATGGSISAIVIGSVTYCRHVFTALGNSTFTPIDERITRVDYLVVAGGGGGGARDTGGGGGAGGVVTNLKPGGVNTAGLAVSAGVSLAVTVGDGGNGSVDADSQGGTGSNGQNSRLGTLAQAVGGGGGANYAARGANGGSGGGNGGYATITTLASLPTAGQGNAGGTQQSSSGGNAGGGGGGFGAAGANGSSTTAGDGGLGGDFSSLLGSDIGDDGWFAGGGGGAQHRNVYFDGRLGGDGGKGGGGGQPLNASTTGTNGQNGIPSTGGGGGAATALGGTSNGLGGKGGSGIVVVRYAMPEPRALLPDSTQQAGINAALSVAAMNSNGTGAVTPRIQGFGGQVKVDVAISFGTFSVGTLGSATASNSTGTTNDDVTEVRAVSLTGTVAEVNAALATLSVVAASDGIGVLTLNVAAALSPRGNQIFFNQYNGHIYELVTTQTNRATAVANAQAMNFGQCTGYLATITAAAEQEIVTKAHTGANFWLGGTDQANEGEWIWDQGPEAGQQFWSGGLTGSTEAGAYENWRKEEVNGAIRYLQPDNGNGSGENFLVAVAPNPADRGAWNDASGSLSLGSLVEFGGSGCDLELATASARTVIYFSGSEVLVPSATLTEETMRWHNVQALNSGAEVRLAGFSGTVTVTIDSNNPSNTRFRLQNLVASAPGAIRSPQQNLNSFARNSSGLGIIVFTGPVAEVNTALESLEVFATNANNTTITVQASGGEGQVLNSNGHTYRIVKTNHSITWPEAFAAAAATKIESSQGGFCQGYLVTITSEAERLFINEKVGGSLVWIGGSDQKADQVWNEESESYVVAARKLYGRTQAQAEADAVEGDFFWASGPERGQPISSGNWRGQQRPQSTQNPDYAYRDINGNIANYPWGNGEPNDWKMDNPGEDFIHILGNGRWNDYMWNNRSVRAYVIEYGGLVATNNHKTFTGAPAGNLQNLRKFEAELDDNLTNPDYVGREDECFGISANSSKSETFNFNFTKRPEPTATLANVTGVAYTPGANPANSQTDLTLNGSVGLDGATVSSVVFEYSVSQTINTDFSAASSSSGVVVSGANYELDLTALPNDHFVNYRMIVTFTDPTLGTVISGPGSMRTLAAPSVRTGGNLTYNFVNNQSFTVSLSGVVNANNVSSSDTQNNITNAEFLVSEAPDLSGATSYPITGAPPTGNTDTTVTTTISDLVAGKTYFYSLRASNVAGTNSGEVRSFTVQGLPSATVQQPSIAADGTVVLSALVNPNLSSLSKIEFIFEEGTSLTPDARPLEILTAGQDGGNDISVAYQLSELTPGDYTYRIDVTNGVGVTESSLQTFSIIGPEPASNLSGSATGPTSANLSWQAPTSGATILDYNIETSTDCVNFTLYPDDFSTATSTQLTSLLPETEYCIRVIAVAMAGEAAASNVIRLRTLAAPVSGVPDGPGASYQGPIVRAVQLLENQAGINPRSSFRVFGDRLASVTSARVDGLNVQVTSAGQTELRFSLPKSLEPGSYDLILFSSFGRLSVVEIIKIPVQAVLPETITPEGTKSRLDGRTFLLPGRVFEGAKLTNQQAGWVERTLANSGLTRIVCTAITSPAMTAHQRIQVRRLARATCENGQLALPGASFWFQSKFSVHEKLLRRVALTFRQ